MPRVHYALPDEDHEDLVPRDTPTLERLVYSAHAHCDLLHRLGQFCASRALAKVLHKLREYHELPLLEAEGKFGSHGAARAPGPGVGPSGSTLDVPPFPVFKEDDPSIGSAPGPVWSRNTSEGDSVPVSRMACHESGNTAVAVKSVCVACCREVRTLYTPCWSCGHGYHVSCLRQWFTSADQKCPAIGCECRCQQHHPVR